MDQDTLPSHWEGSTVGELYELAYGKGLVKKFRKEDGPYPVYGSNGVVGYHDSYVTEGPVVIVGRKGAAGEVHFSPGNCWPIDTTYFVKPKKAVDEKFTYYLLKSLRLKQFETSTAIPGLNRADAHRLRIGVPPLQEQKDIVAKIETLFSELDKGIESLKTARQQLKAYRQAVLKHAFEGKLTEQWRQQNPDKLESPEQLLDRIQQEREQRYQQQLEEWKSAVKVWEENGKEGKKPSKPKALKEISVLDGEVLSSLPESPPSWMWGRLGLMTCGVEYGTSAKSSGEGDVPVVRMGNLQSGIIDWSDLVFTSDKEEIEKYSLKAGDVLFNRTNSPELVGKTAIYKGEREALFAGYLIRVNHISSIVDGRYLNYFLNSLIAKGYGNTVKTDGVNQSNINGEKLQGYPFPFCSLGEQVVVVDALDEKVSAIDRMSDEVSLQLDKAVALRQSILKKAFSGQLVRFS
ncbi:restriction endonuclease subunit S [Microbulbifer sp. RZ01]|uniref:restriction endonuclease subunit S n=1 Tax=Microbulbifer sp. RZ01 TaxID=3021711 RepID=UPI0027E4B65E|nr:restriction endonuclease subunit S [Microbulbifer sp. RZ01]